MGFFDNIKNIFGAKSDSIIESASYPGHVRINFLGDCGLPSFKFDFNSYEGLSSLYNKCAPLSAIINKNAQAMANGEWWLVDENDTNVSKRFPGVKRLLKRPNPLQSWREFMMQLDVYRYIYGHVFVWAAAADEYENSDAYALWVVNPSYVEIELSGKLFNQKKLSDIITKYTLCIGETRQELDPNRVLLINDVFQNTSFSPRDVLGCSRLKSLIDPIRNIITSNEALYSLTKNKGPMGILSNHTKDNIGVQKIDPEEKEKIQRLFRSKYGLTENQEKALITDASLEWQPISFNIKELMLFEGLRENIRQISDVCGYPYDLLAQDKNSTYTNRDNAERQLYQDNILPMAGIYSEAFTHFFNLPDNIKVYSDYSQVEALQEKEVDLATTNKTKNEANAIAFQHGIIDKNEWRADLGLDIKDGDGGNN